MSPCLIECCLRASANVSYENAAQDIERYTGIKVSGKTQQRLVHRHDFRSFQCKLDVGEISVDGGKVRLRTENKGEASIWRDAAPGAQSPLGGYEALLRQAVCVHPQSRMAWFQENDELVEWVNNQSFNAVLNCVGDGHPGVWNLMNQFNPQGETRQILDWFHLVENLYKVGGSLKRIAHGKQLLWRGKVDETLSLFSTLKKKAAYNFCTYLRNHRDRIVDYEHFQTKGICAIASGAVESTVKQIDRRLKISGAQWKVENVPQVLRHRCAYLNNSLFAS